MGFLARSFVRVWHAGGFITVGLISSSVPLVLIGITLAVIMNVWLVPEMKG